MNATFQGTTKVGKDLGAVLVAGSVYTTALAMPQPVGSVTESDVDSGLGAIDTQGYEQLDLIFFGTDAADETVNYQVIAQVPVKTSTGDTYVPVKIAAGAVTLGTLATGAAGACLNTDTDLFADTITEAAGTGYALAFSPADNGVAVLRLNVAKWRNVYVQVELGTAASAGVIGLLGEKWTKLA